MKHIFIAIVIVVIVSSLVLAAPLPATTFIHPLHSGARVCQDSDVQTTDAQGDVVKQSTISGFVKGTTVNGKMFTYGDKCLNTKILQEGGCSVTHSWWGRSKHIRGTFLDLYDVTCPTKCNQPDGIVHPYAWCS